MEPLIHWGTVTPADTLLCCGRIMAFRRDGEKCDDPLWTLAMRKFTPQDPMTYCTGCLDMLMDKAPSIMPIVENKAATFFTAMSTPSASMNIQTNNNSFEENSRSAYFPASAREGERHDSSEHSGDRTLIVSFAMISTHGCLVPCHTFQHLEKHFLCIIHSQIMLTGFQASLSLDGACDAQSVQKGQAQCLDSCTKQDTSIPQSNIKSSTYKAGNDNSRRYSISSFTENSPDLRKSFTQSTTMSCQRAAVPNIHHGASTWATITDLRSSPWALLSDRINSCTDTQPVINPIKPAFKNTSLKASQTYTATNKLGATHTTPEPRQSTKREFGRELDANTVIRPRNRFDSSPHHINMLEDDPKCAADIRKIFKPALKTSLKPKEDAKVKSPSTNFPTKPSEHSSEDSWETTETEEPREASQTPPCHSREQSSDDSWESTDTKGLGVWDDYLLHAAKDDLSPPRKIKPPLKKKSPLRPEDSKRAAVTKEMATGPFFAKRTPMDCPGDISEPIWKAYQARVPIQTEIICSCHKPAQTSERMIAQCSIRGCIIGWYHYDCLNKSGKISCRHGKLMCQFCKNEAKFNTQDAQNGWAVEKMVEAELRMPLTSAETVAAMPQPGGGYGIVNPYGLGALVEEPLPPTKSACVQGALGQLSFFGYEESSPFVVMEAHKNARAYAHLCEHASVEEGGATGEDYVTTSTKRSMKTGRKSSTTRRLEKTWRPWT
jgi:hypothetical protein